ncbi:MAG: hypothetical protein GXY72_09425 [Deltaproteobacteria bacterium]|nr:hypothetical protein [Deltaproteobacteria bacterium]
MKSREILVNDRMQKGYRYLLTEPAGKNFAPDFRPELTPKQMLALGVFGGKYMTDCRGEFPASWFAGAKLSPERHDPKLNCFGVNASKPLSYWVAKGWIHPDDPRGWFQWYCRYWMGRRGPDDARQIGRWKAMQRHIAQLIKHCPAGDLSCRRKQRQALLHWAYDSRKL